MNAHAEPAASTSDNFSKVVKRTMKVLLKTSQSSYITIFSLIEPDRVSATSIHSNNIRFGHGRDENRQNVKSPVQNLSQICDKILVAENQDLVETASEHIFPRTKTKI